MGRPPVHKFEGALRRVTFPSISTFTEGTFFITSTAKNANAYQVALINIKNFPVNPHFLWAVHLVPVTLTSESCLVSFAFKFYIAQVFINSIHHLAHIATTHLQIKKCFLLMLLYPIPVTYNLWATAGRGVFSGRLVSLHSKHSAITTSFPFLVAESSLFCFFS